MRKREIGLVSCLWLGYNYASNVFKDGSTSLNVLELDELDELLVPLSSSFFLVLLGLELGLELFFLFNFVGCNP